MRLGYQHQIISLLKYIKPLFTKLLKEEWY